MSAPIDYARAIQHARPGEEWTLNGEELSGLIWHADTKPPTQAELAKAWAELITQAP